MPRHATGRGPRRDPDATLYVFKVALAQDKSVWRRIAVRSDQTLDHLHAGIFSAFDRFDEHLYSYYLAPLGPKGRAALRDAVEYTSLITLEEPDAFGGHEVFDASQAAVGSLGLTPGREFRYIFDFGDSWWHEITVEQTDGSPERRRYPRVVGKRGESPPQYPELEDDRE